MLCIISCVRTSQTTFFKEWNSEAWHSVSDIVGSRLEKRRYRLKKSWKSCRQYRYWQTEHLTLKISTTLWSPKVLSVLKIYLKNKPGVIFHNNEEFVFSAEARLELRDMASFSSHEFDEETILSSIALLYTWRTEEFLGEKCETTWK